MFIEFLIAYLITNIIEFIFFHICLRGGLRKEAISILIINIVTMPIIWLGLPLFFNYYLLAFVFFESLIIILETIFIQIITQRKILFSLKVSILMNSLSAIIGFFFL